jgi:ABC-type sugar transport system ATPase subunit
MQSHDGSSPFAAEMLGISKRFSGVRALSDVTIKIKRGHVHALVGENGAGKSTLVKILVGVYPSGTYSGRITIDGTAVEINSPFDARKLGIGYVPQELTVIEALSVAENIFVGHLTKNRFFVSKSQLIERAQKHLDECKIDLDAKALVTTLSASQRQLVMIARALSKRPSVLILDESTACLTLAEAKNLFNIVGHLRSQGVAIVLITHKLAEISELADHATVLRDGAVVADFERGDFTQENIVSAMVGRKLEAIYPVRDSRAGNKELLKVEDLSVLHPHLGGKLSVKQLSFSVHEGEILGLAGLVGSGRSEVVNALFGRIPCTGRITIDGQTIRVRSPADAMRHGMGLVTEERKKDGLLFNFNIAKNITLNSLDSISRYGVLDAGLESRCANDFVRRLSIRAPSLTLAVGSLSGGNQQKVVLGKVLMANPRVLFLDEPTKGIDVGAKFEIYKLMFELARQGMALILISSELPELMAMADRFIVLNSGRLADEFTKADASEERLMLAATGAPSSLS